MKAARALGLLVLAAPAQANEVTPVQKAVEMLHGMLATAKTGMNEEQVQYSGFKQFCNDATYEKQQRIQEGDEKMEVLHAHIQKFDTEAERLGHEIAAHEEDIGTWEGEVKTATEERAVQHKDFKAMEADYKESLYAIKEAIAALNKQAFDRPQAAALLQQVKASHPLIEAFLARNSESAAMKLLDAQEPDAYGFRSNGIIDMLEGLKDKFNEELAESQKTELSNRHAYDTVVMSLRGAISAAKSDIDLKGKAKAANEQSSAEANADLQATQKIRTDDNSYLEDLVVTCQQKAADFESRHKLRGEEIDALSQALEILGGKAVNTAADHVRPAAAVLQLTKTSGRSSFAQLRSSASALEQQAQVKVADFLRAASERLNSRVLAAVAVRAQDDPFVKVKKLIQDLVDRLQAEASEEEDHHSWCVAEMSANEATRTQKTEEIETLRGEQDKLNANIAQLTKEIGELSKSVAAIMKNIAKETEMRTAEKAQNEKTLKESQDGQAAMMEVISVLQDFYTKAADATALVQQKGAAPPVFEKEFKGQQTESGNVLAMLQVIQSDFARLESDTANAEESASTEFDAFIKESNDSKDAKETDIDAKSDTKKGKEEDLDECVQNLADAEKELASANTYYDKLKPSCVQPSKFENYDERVEQRKAEVASLQNALDILSGDVHAQVIQGVLVTDAAPQAGPLRSATTGLVN